MRGHGLRVFQRATVVEVGGDAGGAEGVIADGIGSADGLGPALDHVGGVAGGERADRSGCG